MGLHTQDEPMKRQCSSLDHTWISLVCIITFNQDFWEKFMTVCDFWKQNQNQFYQTFFY